MRGEEGMDAGTNVGVWGDMSHLEKVCFREAVSICMLSGHMQT